MSELDTGATAETRPAPDDTILPAEASRGGEPKAESPAGETNTEGAATPSGAPRKRRRRGKRGGRNRNKRPAGAGGAAAGAAPGAAADDDDDDDDDELDLDVEELDAVPTRWTDATADRGYTDDDVYADARDEAGLNAGTGAAPADADDEEVDADDDGDDDADDDGPEPFLRPAVPPPAPRARPATGGGNAAANTGAGTAPATDGPAKKKRRRRGGRGRKKPATVGTPAAGYVEGSLDDFETNSVLDTLDEATLERRRGLQRKGRPTGRYVMVVHTHRESGRSHVAVLEGRNLVEHYVAEPQDDERTIDGNIYLGKVQNVQPGMEAAFVDIGTQKNAILYRGDVRTEDGEFEGERPRIERVLRNGQAIVVQVTKNPIAHKGARLTQEVSLAGRFVVMVPDQPGTYGISKRLPDDERKRLRRVLDRVKPKNAGLIVRTAAEGATEEELERDMRRLQLQWEQIDALAKRAKPGTLLYKEPPLAIRVIREEFTKEYRGVVLDDPVLYEEVKGYIDAVAPELSERVEFYDAATEQFPLFERFHVHEQLHQALDRKVWLPSGGSLVIERTEALTVIDVNTAKNVGKSNLEETVYRNNLEAADVIARELRLRDIGGIIVIDFIDMESKNNRESVERAFRDALARDKTRTQVFPISELGLVEMTRKRISEGLVEAFSETCSHCEGRGILLDLSMLDD
jgi:ribonuclease E